MLAGFETSAKADRIENGGLAQMVERVLSMHEVPGSMPGSSTYSFVFFGDECLLVSKRLRKQITSKTGD